MELKIEPVIVPGELRDLIDDRDFGSASAAAVSRPSS
jgi:hypothetical protein